MTLRRAGTAAAVLAMFAAGAPSVHACQACFGAEDSPLISGAKLGAIALVAVTATVQVAFVAFFLHLRKRARIVAAMEASSPWAEAPSDSR
jgi:hypothetical protein